MSMRFDTLIFPGGKTKAFTLSYDDGVVQDRRLAELFRTYGLKCSFNIGSALLGQHSSGKTSAGKDMDYSKIDPEEVTEVYRGHEICGHGLYHSPLSNVGNPLAMYEIIEDKRRLEALAGKPIKTFAYPYGRYDEDAVQTLRLAGYQGARTVNATHGFELPEDFLVWNPTCHHDDPMLMELAQKFVGGNINWPMLFYVWGHAYEFEREDNWDRIETLAKFISSYADRIWFATNGEILDYVNAYRRLDYSADGSMIYNPSAIDVTIRTTAKDFVTIPGGQVTKV